MGQLLKEGLCWCGQREGGGREGKKEGGGGREEVERGGNESLHIILSANT